MNKLYLLDAYALIYRAYYALIQKPRINSKGMNTSAIYGFVNTLEEVKTLFSPTHLAVAFDPAGKTFRDIRALQGTTTGNSGRHTQISACNKGHHQSLQHTHT